MSLYDDDPPPDGEARAWLCRWPGHELVVWSATIQDARLQAREHAGPKVAVSARLATHAEANQTARTP